MHYSILETKLQKKKLNYLLFALYNRKRGKLILQMQNYKKLKDFFSREFLAALVTTKLKISISELRSCFRKLNKFF